MTASNHSHSALVTALEPVISILNADGYDLEIRTREGGARLEVVPTADACAECLVPEPVFRSIVDHYLSESGTQIEFDVVYPNVPASH